jgi:ABC-2 type transport system permease protein
VARDLGGMQVREIQAINYPFFVDIRSDGMDQKSPILANLPAVTLNWASPVQVDEAKNAGRQVMTLLQSSPASWLRTNPDIQPNLDLYPQVGFPVEGEPQSYPLAVSVQGVFDSYFKDKPSPLTATPEAEEATEPLAQPANVEVPDQPTTVGTIESSPETARLVVIGSAEFLNDIVFDLSASLSGNRYLNSLQFMQNTVDWSVEDLDLLDIRSRGTSTRVLTPLTESEESFWEGLNYVLALLGLLAIGIIWRVRRQSEEPMELEPPAPSIPAKPTSTDTTQTVGGSQ